MSEPKLISPMLDNFEMGDPVSNHNGIRCCPAMEKGTDDKYIVKIISVPASRTQLDALLLTGVYPDEVSALQYFKELSDDVLAEVNILNQLSKLEGFTPYKASQMVQMDDDIGFDIYLLSPYRKSLEKYFAKAPMTHLAAINLGLDLCAALAVCRRAGYLFVDLKPSNVYITGDGGYQIGDLGFVSLNSLNYVSLPNKYRSAYTAPEIADAFSSLNTTVDIYAAGLILYQAYNNGALPFSGDTAPDEKFPAPLYADYEMSEIILKACAPDPADRWQDPIEMGQALVGYMQRNGANDTPIVPPPVDVTAEAEVNASPENDQSVQSIGDLPDAVENTAEDISEIAPADETVLDETVCEAVAADDVVADNLPSEDAEYSNAADEASSDDDFENLSFFLDDLNDETAPENDGSEITYDEISQEVSMMLTQADDLAAHPVPDPVVAPEPIEVPMPEPILTEEEPAEEDTTEPADTEMPVDEADTDADTSIETSEAGPSEETKPVHKKKHWFRNCIIALFILCIIAAGVLFIHDYYLVPIDSIDVIGSEDSLTVHVQTNIDESLLQVVCTDSHGNQFTELLSDGKAVFTGLVPDTAYNVKVVVTGFHRLVGESSTAYSTPVQTNIVQFNAVTGSEDGSAILGFTVDGPDSSQWTVTYSADGEEEKSVTFPSHMVTLTGLTVGKEYTLLLEPVSDLYLTGINEILFTASNLVCAEELQVISCIDNTLVASWSVAEDADVSGWTVRCYNDSGYDETITTAETTAIFNDLDHTQGYTMEVTAAGMSVSQIAFVPQGSITITEFQTDFSLPNQMVLSWESSQEVADEDWLIDYSIVDTDITGTIPCSGSTATIKPVLPGVTYQITLKHADGVAVLSGSQEVAVPDGDAFVGYNVTAAEMTFSMCATPAYPNWNRYYLDASDYKTAFSVGENASYLVYLNRSYLTSDDEIVTLYIIRDEEGKIVQYETTSASWTSMWYKNYCELDIPDLPDTPGNYTISVYFNGALANEQSFTISQ